MRFAVAGIVWLLVLVNPVAAQRLEPGSRLRIKVLTPAGARSQVVTLAAVDSLGMHVVRASGDSVFLPLDVITSLEENIGKRSEAAATWRGLATGLLVGAAVGGGMGLILGYYRTERFADEPHNTSYYVLRGGLLLGAAGGITGGVVGSRQRDQWRAMPLPQPR